MGLEFKRAIKAVCLLLVILTCTLFIVACGTQSDRISGPELLPPVTGEFDTVLVSRGLVAARDSLPAITRSPSVAIRAGSGSGPIDTVYAWPGTVVEQGQVIARLALTHMEQQIESLEEQIRLTHTMHRLSIEEFDIQIGLLELNISEFGSDATATANALSNQLELTRLDRTQAIARHNQTITELNRMMGLAQEALNEAEILAPVSGTVVTLINPGRFIFPNSVLGYIATDEAIFVEYIGPVTSWNFVRLTVIIGQSEYELRRMTIAPAELIEHSALNLPPPTRFSFAQGVPDYMSAGRPAFIRRYTAFVEDALRIPASTLFPRGGGEFFVYKVNPDRTLELVDVTVGVRTEL